MNLLVLLKRPTGDGLMTWKFHQEMIVIKSCSKSVSGEQKHDDHVGAVENDVTLKTGTKKIKNTQNKKGQQDFNLNFYH